MYEQGKGCFQDPYRAFQLYGKCADKDNVKGKFLIILY